MENLGDCQSESEIALRDGLSGNEALGWQDLLPVNARWLAAFGSAVGKASPILGTPMCSVPADSPAVPGAGVRDLRCKYVGEV